MKKYWISLLVLYTGITLVACSDDPSVDSHPKEQLGQKDNVEQQETDVQGDDIDQADSGNRNQDGQVAAGDKGIINDMKELTFLSFDLEVEYANGKDFDYEYEQKSDEGDFEAKLVDQINHKKLQGVEAFSTLHTQMKTKDFDANTPKEDAIQTILEMFSLQDDYADFDLEIQFKDGSKLDIEDNR